MSGKEGPSSGPFPGRTVCCHRSGRSPRGPAGPSMADKSKSKQATKSVRAGRRAGSTCSCSWRRAAVGASMARELRDGALAAGSSRRSAPARVATVPVRASGRPGGCGRGYRRRRDRT